MSLQVTYTATEMIDRTESTVINMEEEAEDRGASNLKLIAHTLEGL